MRTSRGTRSSTRPRASAERRRLAADRQGKENWRAWGPYLSERQWGTVREDYSADGAAWEYLPHDHARSRAYRWGEDGLAGWCDDHQRLCLSLALWNGRDPILKERLFGLTNREGNHGEDVKELYYYLDAVPSHAYHKMLYKYPQAEFPYARLVEENRRRGPDEPEFELLDTGLFDEDRYFDVFVEYAKGAPDETLMLVTVTNRGPDEARLHLMPQLFFRNHWSWKPGVPKPRLSADSGGVGIEHESLGAHRLDCDGAPTLLFCDNETNVRRLFGQHDAPGCFKDAFTEFVVEGKLDAVNPMREGTKAGALYPLDVPAGGSATVRLRLAPAGSAARDPFAGFDALFARRRTEADEFYAGVQHGMDDADARHVQRQAFAGMLWSKQWYHYNVAEWLSGDPAQPPPPSARKSGRNHEWAHFDSADVLSMPDTWEFPWFGSWDLAFHCFVLAYVDPEFSKSQLILLLREWYMHPNGQLPAYEWAFGDVNPPVHAWAAYRVFQIDRFERRRTRLGDPGDLAFLERVFQKLLLNFTWWVNREDEHGRNVFQGGFLGLDNVGVFDRSKPLPTGGMIDQADGTSWMAMYCLNMLRIASELALRDHVYEDIATKFFEHFMSIAAAINGVGDGAVGLWDEEDQFYYDHVCLPDGRNIPLKLESIVGLLPILAVQALDPEVVDELPEFAANMAWYLEHLPGRAALVSNWQVPGRGERRLLSLLRGHRLKALLRRMLDDGGFLSDFGVRSISKFHESHPFRLAVDGIRYEVDYTPGESRTRLFGGNSNWRGPVWLPVNLLLIEALEKFHYYYGDDFTVECPTGSGRFLTLKEVADDLGARITRLFLKGEDGERPSMKSHPKLSGDPHFRDHVLFHEYFHGETGRGMGASHQTGWTALVAKLLLHEASPAGGPEAPGAAAAPAHRGKKDPK